MSSPDLGYLDFFAPASIGRARGTWRFRVRDGVVEFMDYMTNKWTTLGLSKRTRADVLKKAEEERARRKAAGEIGRYQNPVTQEWWRIAREGETGTGLMYLESISDRSLSRGLSWAYARDVSTEMLGSDPSDYHAQAEVKKQMEAYLALDTRERMAVR
jgi:hypothetical protein